MVAVLQGLLVTFLWSTSWVLIKVGLDDLDLRPLSFAGLRYGLAAAILLPFGLRAIARARRSAEHARPDSRLWRLVVIYGLLFVAVAQGAQFAALAVLPATLIAVVAGNGVLGPWLPVHLLLAGSATTAIAGVMPVMP